MTLSSRSGFCGLLIMTAVAAFLADARPAAAQGGIVCEFGSTRYRRCCTESYDRRPNLGARARADDIDACMNRSSRDRDSGRDTGRDGDRESRRGKTTDTVPPATALRRIDCGSRGCPEGCGPDEIAVSAFCKVGEFPSPNGERDVQCATTSGAERPTVLICGKR
jgi:hypothetical protein